MDCEEKRINVELRAEQLYNRINEIFDDENSAL